MIHFNREDLNKLIEKGQYADVIKILEQQNQTKKTQDQESSFSNRTEQISTEDEADRIKSSFDWDQVGDLVDNKQYARAIEVMKANFLNHAQSSKNQAEQIAIKKIIKKKGMRIVIAHLIFYVLIFLFSTLYLRYILS